MKRNARFVFPLMIFMIVAVFLYRGLRIDPHEIQSPLIGKLSPTFSAPSVFDSKKMITDKIFRGHISVLNIFASWCVSCREEHAQLMQLHREDPSAQMIGLAFKDKPKDVRAYLQKSGNPYAKVINDENGNIGINYGVYGTPETFVIDQGGVIRSKIIGPISPEILKDELLPLVKKLQKTK